ncbi:MAG: uroporphyrinogen decarboxylase [Planctomycetes bacterium]|nr:uroporphyrinogen decarboxylase [Planctomycetota bacterium]
MKRMSSRERVYAAISHQPPDRVPIDLNITLSGYENLRKYLGPKIDENPAPNAAMEVIPDPGVLQSLGVDLVSVKLGGGISRFSMLPETITDGWGITRKLAPQSVGAYYEVTTHPLAGSTSDDLKDYPWPDPCPLKKAEALQKQAEELYNHTDLALVGRFGGPILELAADLLGLEEWYLRLAMDKEFIAALLDKIGAICTADDLFGIEYAGQYVQIMKVSGEDFGGQNGPLYSLEMFREILLPPLRHRWQTVREKLDKVNPTAKIMLHSCGAVRSFIPDLIDTGVIDILDPVQPLASDMQPAGLKAEFGDRLVFHGGIDIQRLLPFGTPEEVAAGTVKCLKGFRADRGGFILAPSHSVQADVPPQNILAMVEATKEWVRRS